MGFLAGGHLASTIATHSEDEAKPIFKYCFMLLLQWKIVTLIRDSLQEGTDRDLRKLLNIMN